jgi:hypothetical protein
LVLGALQISDFCGIGVSIRKICLSSGFKAVAAPFFSVNVSETLFPRHILSIILAALKTRFPGADDDGSQIIASAFPIDNIINRCAFGEHFGAR